MTALEEAEQHQLDSLALYQHCLQSWFGIALDWEFDHQANLDMIRLCLTQPPMKTISVAIFLQDAHSASLGRRDHNWGDKAICRAHELLQLPPFT